MKSASGRLYRRSRSQPLYATVAPAPRDVVTRSKQQGRRFASALLQSFLNPDQALGA